MKFQAVLLAVFVTAVVFASKAVPARSAEGPAPAAPAEKKKQPAQPRSAGALEPEAFVEGYDAAQGASAQGAKLPLVLDSVAVMRLTVKFSPEIRRAYERKLSEEARYDFFIANREAFTYGGRTAFHYDRDRFRHETFLNKTLSPQVFVRKEFYNTARTSLDVGYDFEDLETGGESNAFVAASLQVPLFASREALQRSNDKIFQQNEVNDARLAYLEEIRWQISEALESLAGAQRDQETLAFMNGRLADLEKLTGVANSIAGRDASGDLVKLQATIASVKAGIESEKNGLHISAERLKNVIGIPFETELTITDEDFAPFGAETQEDLERVALDTDEEIKTLLNSVRAAQAELELARKGKWDTTFFVSGTREFAGAGETEGDASYDLATGVEVTHIDNRISKSLERVALANIREYKNSIINRRREIHTDILDAYTNLKGMAQEVRAREANLARYLDDYAKGIDQYVAGAISIDELIQKRQAISNEQDAVADARHGARTALASLLSSTGRYEEFVGKDRLNGQPIGAQSSPVKAAPETAAAPAPAREPLPSPAGPEPPDRPAKRSPVPCAPSKADSTLNSVE